MYDFVAITESYVDVRSFDTKTELEHYRHVYIFLRVAGLDVAISTFCSETGCPLYCTAVNSRELPSAPHIPIVGS
jgi:hypothetical protein